MSTKKAKRTEKSSATAHLRSVAEWQVVLGHGIEVHIFREERTAKAFARENPTTQIYEGGLVEQRRPAPIRKVVRYYHPSA